MYRLIRTMYHALLSVLWLSTYGSQASNRMEHCTAPCPQLLDVTEAGFSRLLKTFLFTRWSARHLVLQLQYRRQ